MKSNSRYSGFVITVRIGCNEFREDRFPFAPYHTVDERKIFESCSVSKGNIVSPENDLDMRVPGPYSPGNLNSRGKCGALGRDGHHIRVFAQNEFSGFVINVFPHGQGIPANGQNKVKKDNLMPGILDGSGNIDQAQWRKIVHALQIKGRKNQDDFHGILSCVSAGFTSRTFFLESSIVHSKSPVRLFWKGLQVTKGQLISPV